MAEYELPATNLRYRSNLAANDALGILNAVWLNYFVELAVAKIRIPSFGSQQADKAQTTFNDLLETSDAVHAVTDPNGISWVLWIRPRHQPSRKNWHNIECAGLWH